MKVIYLAGGMRSNWQDTIQVSAPMHAYFDPRYHGMKTESAYTEWDTKAIGKSDLIVAVMEPDNPSGYGLNFEVGYARALDIPIWFLMDGSDSRSNYFGLVRASSDRVFTDIHVLAKELTSL